MLAGETRQYLCGTSQRCEWCLIGTSTDEAPQSVLDENNLEVVIALAAANAAFTKLWVGLEDKPAISVLAVENLHDIDGMKRAIGQYATQRGCIQEL